MVRFCERLVFPFKDGMWTLYTLTPVFLLIYSFFNDAVPSSEYSSVEP